MLQNLHHIPQFSMVSVIDILVVAFLIYEFLKLIKGTRAIPMLAAVVLIVGAFWIAHIEQLRTVDWLITTLFPYAVFSNSAGDTFARMSCRSVKVCRTAAALY